MKEFRIAKGWSILIYVTAPVMILVFVTILISPLVSFLGSGISNAYGFLAPVSLIMIAILVFGLIDAVKGKFIIGEDKVYTISTTGNRQLNFNEIKGYTLNDKYIFIESNNPGKKRIKISKYFGNTNQIIVWLSSRYPNLDTLKLEQETKEILNDQQYGITAEARSEKLKNARKTAKICNIIGGLVGGWSLFLPRPYELAIIASIIVFIVFSAIFKKANGLIRIDERKDSAYPSIFVALCVPCVGLLIRAILDYNIFSYNNVWLPVVLTVGLFLALFMLGNSELKIKSRGGYTTIIIISLMLLAFAYGSVIALNCAFDDSPSKTFNAKILDKRVSNGKTTTYYFKLTPWGPQKETEEVTVQEETYRQLNKGSEVQVVFREGKVNIPWFIVTQ